MRFPLKRQRQAAYVSTGKKEHNADQWWLNAFDNQLKALDVSKNSTGEVKVEQTMKNTPIGMTFASRYYIRFVSGGILTGGVEQLKLDQAAAAEVSSTASTTPSGSDSEKKRSKEERRKAREERKAKKAKKALKKSSKGREESKEDRRERKRLKRLVAREMAALSV